MTAALEGDVQRNSQSSLQPPQMLTPTAPHYNLIGESAFHSTPGGGNSTCDQGEARMARSANDLGPDPIDVYVGIKLRGARKARGCSQEQLAKSLGLTFQQVQKYERGANRISSSMLVRSARYLRISVSSLLPPDEAETESLHNPTLQLIASIRGSDELILAFGRIKSPRLRRQMVILAQALAAEGDLERAA